MAILNHIPLSHLPTLSCPAAVAGLIGAIGSGIFPLFTDWGPYAPHKFHMYPAMNPVQDQANCLQNPNQAFGAG